MQSDGDLVFRTMSATRSVGVDWRTGTGFGGSTLSMQDDGNLVVYAPNGAPKWWVSKSGSGFKQLR
jgi:hypothetical protein